MTATREFTENWLQAIILAASNETARRIRPWITDIGHLCASEKTEGQLESASRVWNYGQGNGLTGLLSCTPLHASTWKFEEDECFQFERGLPASPIESEQAFCESLGLVSVQVPLRASVTASDWTNLLRREAVRRSKPLNVQAIPSGSMLHVECVGNWDTQRWQVTFLQPDWLSLEPSGVVQSERPEKDARDALLLDAIAYANRNFQVAAKLSRFEASDALWMSCVDRMYDWHRSVLLTNELGLHPWFRRVWSGVWPVIYRERNRLRGACDLQTLRTELAECFASAPLLTEWMFVFARLACELQWERGLGIAGDFCDR
jgi:hypothetical protein